MKHERFDGFRRLPDFGLRVANVDGAAQSWTAYTIAKRAFDILMSIALLPALCVLGVILVFLNPSRNTGPLFFVQDRMGKGCRPFRAIKFRSMTLANAIERGANDPLETDRITPLGDFLRKSRIDELPQIINVLKGEMSLIGPRPDYYVHAQEYLITVPGYRARHAVLPGISGYAQTEVGYVDSIEGTRAKVAADLYYIANRNFALDTWLVWRTIKTVLIRGGA